jgi:hypothetical protein
MGLGIQQRKRGLRLGCGTKQFFSGTVSGSTAATAEEQDFPSASIRVQASGLLGTPLSLVLGIAVPVLFLVRGSVLLPKCFRRHPCGSKQSAQVGAAPFETCAASLRDKSPDIQTKNERPE